MAALLVPLSDGHAWGLQHTRKPTQGLSAAETQGHVLVMVGRTLGSSGEWQRPSHTSEPLFQFAASSPSH